MPEGPSIVILREEVAAFAGKKVLRVSGTAKIDLQRIAGKKVIAFRSWGKHFLIQFEDIAVRIHLLMFGSYRINEARDIPPRLNLKFSGGELSFYNCSVRYIEGPLDETYDWSVDIMSDYWDGAAARRKLRAKPDMLVCDAVLDQTLFSGAGNIFKNEVLFRIRVHPLSKVGALPARKLGELVDQVRVYAFQFLEWKKAFVLRKHWLAHTKSICPRCDIPFKRGHLGKTQRRSFFCERCQKKYSRAPLARNLRSPKTSRSSRAL
jgi:endonuclease-8